MGSPQVKINKMTLIIYLHYALCRKSKSFLIQYVSSQSFYFSNQCGPFAFFQQCSSRCGNGGVRMREVHCSTDIRKPSTTWEVHYQTVDPKYCRNSKTLGEPPASEQACNRGVKCPGRWRKGNWSQVSTITH